MAASIDHADPRIQELEPGATLLPKHLHIVCLYCTEIRFVIVERDLTVSKADYPEINRLHQLLEFIKPKVGTTVTSLEDLRSNIYNLHPPKKGLRKTPRNWSPCLYEVKGTFFLSLIIRLRHSDQDAAWLHSKICRKISEKAHLPIAAVASYNLSSIKEAIIEGMDLFLAWEVVLITSWSWPFFQKRVQNLLAQASFYKIHGEEYIWVVLRPCIQQVSNWTLYGRVDTLHTGLGTTFHLPT
jgi:hypothetical protein